MTHRLTWFEPRRADGQLREFFIAALLDIGASLTLQDADGHYICITSLPPRWPLAAGQEPSDDSIFGPEIGARLKDLKAGLEQPGDGANLEVEPGDDTVFEFRCRLIRMSPDYVCLMTVLVDRTEERRRERLLRALLREVSHRSKNLLAIIQSIAFQTARYSGTLDQFLAKFRGRLHALSTSQDLVTDSSWRGAYFHDLVRQQMEKYVPETANLVHVTGENVLLSPNAALHIGLALHELVVNAISHGDFVSRRAIIEIGCSRLEGPDGEEIRVTWTEPLSPGLTTDLANTKAGRFGSTVLERVVPASVNGRVLHRLEGGSVYYELIFPAELHD
ncbi:sensor histidine kinase [Rhizobium paknamense]|uniref:histidine kinase n=1 Tax=Rhizobium paknamense TaxID=1206817 RepID=A0ABU0IIT4_9HYPH|nr:sensor histidine kinase [Rhizobium paknamense]MDQ0458170.1 two-component sensor histidine kinase [Rhizobium paknamense]